jgi:hypothetical protein
LSTKSPKNPSRSRFTNSGYDAWGIQIPTLEDQGLPARGEYVVL